MKVYETLHLVKGEDLNHHETLFAARTASWLIEAGFATAASEHGDTDEVVLRNVHEISYVKPVKKGTIVKLKGRVVLAGSSSLMVAVTAENSLTGEKVVESYFTFVTIHKEKGGKCVHGVVLDEPVDEEEERLRTKALKIKETL